MNDHKSKGASQARRAAALARNENVDEAGVPLISPEEWKEFKRMEALNQAAINKRLREEYAEHLRLERKFKS